MQIIQLDIERESISLNSGDILSLLGSPGEWEDHHTPELVDRYIVECREIMNPKGGYIIGKASDTGSIDTIETEGIRFNTGKIVNRMLSKSEEFALFLATAGPAPESLSRNLIKKGHFLDGYLVDLIGSAIVESAASLLHEQIRNNAGIRGKQVTNRYSPGYCTWNVDEQQKLFSLFPAGFCGISLSEASLMSPIKSVSGIIGIGSGVHYQEYVCDNCGMKECIFRKGRN